MSTFDDLNKMLDGLLNLQASKDPEAHKDDDTIRAGLVKSWTRLFEASGMPHNKAEEQAKLSVTGEGTLVENLQLAGFSPEEAKYFLEGRGGEFSPDLTDYKPKPDKEQHPGEEEHQDQHHLTEAERDTIIEKVIALHYGRK